MSSSDDQSAARRPEMAPAVVGWDEARYRAHAAAVPLPACSVPLAQASGLTLAADLRALAPMPAFDTAAMDGYAVAGSGPYRVVGQIAAGGVWGRILQVGEAVSICTGALVPIGATAVLRIEQAHKSGSLVHGPALTPGTHIRRVGEDAMTGACLAPAGTPVRPPLLGLAAAAGYDALLIRSRPGVAVLVTGDELIHSGPSGSGRVRDALGPTLPALIDDLGGQVTELSYVSDRSVEQLGIAIGSAAIDAGVVIVTGSTSIGSTDGLRPFLARSGARWIVDTVACRPAHPQLLARIAPERWLIGLPGNPYAAIVAAHTLLAPLLAGLVGRSMPPLAAMAIRGVVPPGRPGQTQLLPVAWDGTFARVLAGHQPAFLRGAASADALAVIRPDWTRTQPAPVLPWR